MASEPIAEHAPIASVEEEAISTSPPLAARVLDAVLCTFVILILLFAPVYYGGNRPLALHLIESAVLVATAFAIVRVLWFDSPAPGLRHARWVLGFGVAWVCFVAIQVLPMPAAVVGAVSPSALALQTYATNEVPRSMALSIDRWSTVDRVLEFGAYIAFLFCVIVAGNERRRLLVILAALCVVPVLGSFYGLVNLAMGADSPLWVPSEASLQFATGTFVNRNHFGAWLVFGVAAALGVVVAQTQNRRRSVSWQQSLRRSIDTVMSPRGLAILAMVVLVGALLLSNSRGAVLAAGAASVLVFLTIALVRGRIAPEVRLVPFLIASLVLGVFWFGAGGLGRLFDSDFGTDERLTQWDVTLEVINDYTLTGAGAGSYRTIFPLYRDGSLRPLLYDHVHNDFLETLAGQGIVGFTLIGLMLCAAYIRLVGACRRRRSPLVRGTVLAAMLGCTALLFHGFVDFSFQIPANCLYFFGALGLGIAASGLPHRGRSRHA